MGTARTRVAGRRKRLGKAESFIEHLLQMSKAAHKIPGELYAQYGVKRGLRNEDGTGVLVGLTEIGNVRGYVVVDNVKRPCEGVLQYRGIDVREIAEGCAREKRHGFEETCFLLLFGKLPTKSELEQYCALLDRNRDLESDFTETMIFNAPSADIMNKLARNVLSSYSYDPSPEPMTLRNVMRQCIEMVARFPTMVTYAYQAKLRYQYNKSLFIHYPRGGVGTAENFLHLTRPDSAYTKLEADTLDLCLILHAEHGGGNNSTFATHVIMSAGTDVYSATAAAVGSLKGVKHGGANIKVVGMMDAIKKQVRVPSEKRVADCIRSILRREMFDREGLVYGFGHAVYTMSDPRAAILKAKAAELAGEAGRRDEFAFYEMVERLAPRVINEHKKTDRPICANVDFYSGLVYRMLGIPEDLFTPLFAVARVAGWSAHVIEEYVSGGRIIRPAYKSVTHEQSYVPLIQRT